MQIIEIGSFAISALMVARFDKSMLAAHQIGIQYAWAAMSIIFSMAQAISVRVGHFIGGQKFEYQKNSNIRLVLFAGISLSFLLGMIAFIIFEVGTKLLLKLDIDVVLPENQTLATYGSMVLKISGIILIFESMRIAGFGFLRGLKDTRYPMIISLVSFSGVGLGSAYFLGIVLEMKLMGVWIGLGIGMLLGMCMILLRAKSIIEGQKCIPTT